MRALIASDRLGISWIILLAAMIFMPMTAKAQQTYLLGELQGGASITGQVFDAVTGQPIEGASMAVEGINFFAPILTDAQGHYELPGVGPGFHRVTAGHPDYFPETRSVLVDPGGAGHADFHLHPIDPALMGSIRGTVTRTADGSPIAEATISYRRIPDNFTGLDSPVSSGNIDGMARVMTDAQGHYEINGLREGAYFLQVGATGFSSEARRTHVPPGPGTVEDFALRSNVNHGPASIEGIAVEGAGMAPLPGTRIHILQGFGILPIDPAGNVAAPDFREIPHVLTGTDGYFRIHPLRPGPYHLWAVTPNHPPLHKSIDLRPGATVNTVFHFGDSTPDSGRVSGRVTSGDVATNTQSPVGGARVLFHPLDNPNLPPPGAGTSGFPISILEPIFGLETTTNNVGEYESPPLRPGRWSVEVIADGFEPQIREVDVTAGSVTTADFHLTGHVPGGGSVEGRVTGVLPNALFPIPLPNALVFYETLGVDGGGFAPLSVQTDADGRYTIPHLPSGAYELRVIANGFISQSATVQVIDGTTSVQDFELLPEDLSGSNISGHVYEGDANSGVQIPVPNATVFFYPEFLMLPGSIIDPAQWSVQTDANGFYSTRDLQPGPYVMEVHADGFLTVTAQVHIQSVPVQRDFFLRRDQNPPDPGSIQGQVSSSASPSAPVIPIEGAEVHLLPLQFPEGGTAVVPGFTDPNLPFVLTDAQGSYRFDQLPPGAYVLHVSAPGHQSQTANVDLPAGGVETQDFVLRPSVPNEAGSISGTVGVAQVGAVSPIADAVVTATTQSATGNIVTRSTRTNAQGEFSFPNMPLGGYLVTASAPGYSVEVKTTNVQANQDSSLTFVLQPTNTADVGSIEGTVTILHGNGIPGAPLPGLPVWVVPDDDTTIAIVYGETTTGPDGNYRLDNIPAGPVRVLVGFAAGSNVPSTSQQSAIVLAGETITVDFELDLNGIF